MMLLQNDFYLETRGHLFSQEISGLIENTNYLKEKLEEHANDLTIHKTGSTSIEYKTVYNNTYVSGGQYSTVETNFDGLTEDTVVYLSIGENPNTINRIIAETPHNLNGYSLVFMFVVPENYENENEDTTITDEDYKEYVLNINDESLLFEGFFNGTLFIVGDYLHDTYVNGVRNFVKFTPKTEQAINSPVKYDGVNVKELISKIYKEIDNSEQINEIIAYEEKDTTVEYNNLNKIIIRGTSLNANYTVVTLSNITAKTYVKNLKFESSLEADDNDQLKIVQVESSMPTADKFLLHYPFENDLDPLIGDSFSDFLNNEINKPIVNLIGPFLSYISGALVSIENGYTAAHTESGTGDSIMSCLSTIIKTEDVGLNATLTLDQIESLYSSLKNSTDYYATITGLAPASSYSSYVNNDGSFLQEKFVEEVNVYSNNLSSYISTLSGIIEGGYFGSLLTMRPDLVLSDASVVVTAAETAKIYAETYFVPYAQIVLTNLDKIQTNIINKLSSVEDISSTSQLSFTTNGSAVEFAKANFATTSSDTILKQTIHKSTVPAIHMTYNLQKGTYGYISQKTDYTKYLAKLLFESNTWTDLTQKFNANAVKFSPLFDSQKDCTLTLWTKFDKTTEIDNISFLSFLIGDDFKFSIKAHSYSTINTNTNSGDDLGNIDSADLKTTDVFGENTITGQSKDRNAWIFWSIKFDNTSKEMFKGAEDIDLDFRKKIGLKVTAYTFEYDAENRGEILKHELNGTAMLPEHAVSQQNCKAYLENNFINEPFISDTTSEDYISQYDDVSFNLGYSKEPSVSTSNTYFYEGFFRNLIIFKGHLTESEEVGLFKKGILNEYNWPEQYDINTLDDLMQNDSFFLGLVGIYDSTNINIQNCITKFNGKTYILEN